jgi:hypothetical protein
VNIKEISLPFYEQVLDFLASGPSVEEIIQFRPPMAAQTRFSYLLEVNQQRKLTAEEEDELEHYIQIERMVSLLKAKAYRRLNVDTA